MNVCSHFCLMYLVEFLSYRICIHLVLVDNCHFFEGVVSVLIILFNILRFSPWYNKFFGKRDVSFRKWNFLGDSCIFELQNILSLNWLGVNLCYFGIKGYSCLFVRELHSELVQNPLSGHELYSFFPLLVHRRCGGKKTVPNMMKVNMKDIRLPLSQLIIRSTVKCIQLAIIYKIISLR